MKLTKQQLQKIIREEIERVDVGPEPRTEKAFMLAKGMLDNPNIPDDVKAKLEIISDTLNWIIKTDSGRKLPR